MDEAELPPREFANRVVRMVAEHLLSDSIRVPPKELTVLRMTYRSQGGSWEALQRGDMAAIELLKNIVTAWGQLPQTQALLREEWV